LPTGYAKARTLGVPVTLDEFGHLEASAKTSKQATWEWIRSSLNAATIPCPKLIELCRPVGAMASATGCTGFSAGLKVIDTRRNRIPHVFGTLPRTHQMTPDFLFYPVFDKREALS